MNQNKKIISECLKVLNHDGLILFPTDTILGLGCDANSDKGVDRIINLKNRSSQKGFIVLVSSVESLSHYATVIPDEIIRLIVETENPLSIIYPKGRNLSKHVLGEDGSVAIRLVKDGFSKELLDTFGKAIVATSVNQSGKEAAVRLKEVSDVILKGVDYVVNLPELSTENRKASTIIKLDSDGKTQIIRK